MSYIKYSGYSTVTDRVGLKNRELVCVKLNQPFTPTTKEEVRGAGSGISLIALKPAC